MKRYILAIAIVGMLVVAGCNEDQQRAASSMAANVGVQILVSKVIERSSDQQATAQKIVAAIDQVNESGNLHGVGERIRDAIGYSKLPVSEQLAVDALLISADQYIHDNMTVEQEQIAKQWLMSVKVGAARFL